MLDYSLEHLFSYYITVSAPELLGPLPEGVRLNFYITGGKMTGPRVVGKVRTVGADWVTIRPDGIGVVDVNGLLKTHDGALIDVRIDGAVDVGEHGYEQILAGSAPPSPTRVRAHPRFHTGHPDYLWLNRVHCLAIGEVRFNRFRVDYDVYAVR